jgi:cell division transport system ATP-binding protein
LFEMCYTTGYMITFNGVSKIYSTSSIGLKDINLHIEAGEFVSIVGQSGVGKTTLVRLMIAEERPTAGKVEIGGWDISKIKRGDIPYLRRQIGVIFQDFKLLPKKTVFENIAFALEVAGTSSERIAKVVPQVIDIVGLSDKANRYPNQLSGGEQQRVVIARSLVHTPKIIVADEPTGNLDSINTGEIIEILKKINEFGTTVVLVTHNREVVNHLHRRVITLHAGKIINDELSGKYVL